jgi:hypothetical protein
MLSMLMIAQFFSFDEAAIETDSSEQFPILWTRELTHDTYRLQLFLDLFSLSLKETRSTGKLI